MKNKFILLLLLSFAALCLHAQSDEELLVRAEKAYAAGRYREALDVWEAIDAGGKFSGEMFLNMALAAWQLGDAPRALAYARRAQRLNPLLKDARRIEDMARNKLELSSPVEEFWLLRWWRILYTRLSANAWAALALLFAWLMALFLLIEHRRGNNLLRSRTVGLALGGLFLFFVSLSASRAQRYVQTKPEELVLLKATPLHVGADTDSPKLEDLSPGMELRVLDQIGNWYKVMASSGQVGWVERGVVCEV